MSFKKHFLTLEKCDIIKVSMMLCVMFYHCISLWSSEGWFNQPPAESSKFLEIICAFLNTFHIYVFAFVSGYLFYFLKYEKKRYKNYLSDIGHRAKRLLIPYAVTSLFWVIPFYVYFFDADFKQVLLKFVLATAPNQLWFLIMIFVVFVAFYLLSNFFKKHNFAIGFIVTVLIYCVATVGGVLIPNIFQIWTACKYMFFYFLGFSFRKYKDNLFYKVPWIVYFVIHVGLFALNIFVIKNRVETIFQFAEIAITPVINTFGVLNVVIGLSKFNYEKLFKTKIFMLLSKHNFVMYLLHQQLIYVTISLFNSRVSTPLLVIINWVASFSISLGMAIIISKIPVVKKAFGYR